MIKYDNDILKNFTKDISDTEQMKAEKSIAMVMEAIDDYNWAEVGLKFPKVKLKGSYHNNTNVKIDSDVDIYVLFEDFFSINTQKQCISVNHKCTGKRCEYYRKHLEIALKYRFGSQIRNGNKVFKIKETSYKHQADVMTAFIAKDDKGSDKHNGVYLFFNNNTTAITYPEQNKLNSDLKDKDTYGDYKNMVRLFKGIKNDLNLETPSFLIECMVYNIDDMYIKNSSTDYLCKARNIVYLWKRCLYSQANQFVELNGIKYLFASNQKWNVLDAMNFVNKMQEVLF